MYAKSTRPSAKREVQKDRSAKRAMRMCPRSGQIFYNIIIMLKNNSILCKTKKLMHLCREYLQGILFWNFENHV